MAIDYDDEDNIWAAFDDSSAWDADTSWAESVGGSGTLKPRIRKQDKRKGSYKSSKSEARRKSGCSKPDRSRKSSSKEVKGTKCRSPRRNPNIETGRGSRSRSPEPSISPTDASPMHVSPESISGAMRGRVIRQSRPVSVRKDRRARSLSRTPSRRKLKVPIELSTATVCSRATERAQRRESWRTSRRNSSSDVDSDFEMSVDDRRRKSILDISRKGPIRALTTGRKSLDGEGSGSFDSGEETEISLLLENSGPIQHQAELRQTEVPCFDPYVRRNEERTARRVSANASSMQPDYNGSSRQETTHTRIAERKSSIGSRSNSSLERTDDHDSTVDDILRSRRLRRASASHRRLSADGSGTGGSALDPAARRGSATHKKKESKLRGILGRIGS